MLPGELVVNGAEWAGYFLGAKGSFVSFAGHDGWNGGMPFAVYSAASGKKLFEDSGDAVKSVAIKDGALVLRYRRVWLAPCSLLSEGCWTTITAATSLTDIARLNCQAKYREAMTAWPQNAEDTERSPTVISYDTEARYAEGKLSFKPQPGRAECWLQN